MKLLAVLLLAWPMIGLAMMLASPCGWLGAVVLASGIALHAPLGKPFSLRSTTTRLIRAPRAQVWAALMHETRPMAGSQSAIAAAAGEEVQYEFDMSHGAGIAWCSGRAKVVTCDPQRYLEVSMLDIGGGPLTYDLPMIDAYLLSDHQNGTVVSVALDAGVACLRDILLHKSSLRNDLRRVQRGVFGGRGPALEQWLARYFAAPDQS